MHLHKLPSKASSTSLSVTLELLRINAYKLYKTVINMHEKSEAPTHHYDAWSTESALAAITFGNSFLDRMRVCAVADTFYGNDMLAINTHQRSQTCIHRGVIDLFGCWI